MAVYRRNWNGLTCLNPEVDTFPEDMTLKVFPIPKRVRIQTTVVRKRSRMSRMMVKKNRILWAITGAAFVVMILAACTLQTPTLAAFLIMGICGAWMTAFLTVNEGRLS